jgi:hypothetical protein
VEKMVADHYSIYGDIHIHIRIDLQLNNTLQNNIFKVK